MSSNYLITGGMGFIGSHLTEQLLNEGHQVTVVDNLASAVMTVTEINTRFSSNPRFSLQLMSVTDFCRHASRVDLDGVFHLASPVGPAGVLRHQYLADQIVNDAIAIAEFAYMHGTRLVFVSTSEVYGGGQGGLCREDMPCIVPPGASKRLEYAMGKLAAETALINRTRERDFDVVIVRPFNVAGPRQNPDGGFVLPRFLMQAHHGGMLTVFGNGTAIRAFTHVREVADGIARAKRRGECGQVYNLGNPANRVTINELATAVVTFLGRGSIQHVDPQEVYGNQYTEANDKFPDASKANQVLGWHPTLTLGDIISDAYLDLEAQIVLRNPYYEL